MNAFRTCALSALMLTVLDASAADPNFLESDVDVIHTLTGEQPFDGFGWVGEDLGDIDSDGASDFIIGAPFFLDGADNVGKVYVYSGATGALLAQHAGDAPFELMGVSASLAGDLDADGTNDYVAGTFLRVVAWSGADHSVLWEYAGPGENLGFDADTAGDLNGDGHDDVIVGASAAAAKGPRTGAVHALSGIDGSVLWSRDGDEAGDILGSAVGRLGDVNGDGSPDVVAGARSGGLKDRGIAYALSGADGAVLYTMAPVGLPSNTLGIPIGTYATFFAAGGGDIDGDGVGDIYVGDYDAQRGGSNPNSPDALTTGTGRAYVYSGRDGHRLGVLNAEKHGSGFGPGRIVPDVDGDGRDDIYVAAYTWGPNAEGKAYLVSGRGGVIRTMTGTQPGANLGVDAVGLDDVDGDGATDFLLTGTGVVHVIAGH